MDILYSKAMCVAVSSHHRNSLLDKVNVDQGAVFVELCQMSRKEVVPDGDGVKIAARCDEVLDD